MIYGNNTIFITSPTISIDFLSEVREKIETQNASSQRYSGQINNRKMFYVISRGKIWDHDVYLVSYMWDSYRDDLVHTLFRRLVVVMTFILILSWLPAIFLSRYLSKPLVALERRVKKLANHEWDESFQLDRKDEIGELGDSIEQLRNQLLKQDESQQSFLQHVSHELKTPVMVIRSYSQAIRDGIYPKGNLDCTLQVIDNESERLEKRIGNLLYLTKLDYLSLHNTSKEIFSLDELIKEVVERLRWRRNELDWFVKLEPIKIKGDIEQWIVVLENLLDNQIRYSDTKISVFLTKSIEDDKEKALLKMWNDGDPIEDKIMERLFDKFNKGYKGQFGLGLAIVYRIVTLHDSKIWAENEEDGVSFYVEIPLSENKN
jgi:two-component system sensor histidine kinase CssS